MGLKRRNVLISSGLSLTDVDGKKIAKIKTKYDFNAVEIEYSLIGVAGGISVLNAIIERSTYCDGPPLDCNIRTAVTAPTYAARIVSERTGVTGLSLGGSVANPDNVVDNNPTFIFDTASGVNKVKVKRKTEAGST